MVVIMHICVASGKRGDRLYRGPDEDGRFFRDDRVAVSAQEPHTTGYPMR